MATMTLALFITCMMMTIIIAGALSYWVNDASPGPERHKRIGEFEFVMVWMAILDLITLILAIITKIAQL